MIILSQGWSMSQYLPYSEFKWLDLKEIDKSNVNSIDKNSSDGYILILEINFEYPGELHECHDYPLALETLKINFDLLSKYYNNIANE